MNMSESAADIIRTAHISAISHRIFLINDISKGYV